jgi:hypothetical protein
MKIITKEIAARLPALYANEGKAAADVPVVLKLFNPCGAGTWYITEGELDAAGDHTQSTLFGLCCIHEAELGYVNLGELLAVKLRFGLKIERDLHWSGSLADAYRREGLAVPDFTKEEA